MGPFGWAEAHPFSCGGKMACSLPAFGRVRAGEFTLRKSLEKYFWGRHTRGRAKSLRETYGGKPLGGLYGGGCETMGDNIF
ncbi:hypothetical protein D5272_02840 [bacterium D16-76]|nr:hypothetical protein [bacterium D16-76]